MTCEEHAQRMAQIEAQLAAKDEVNARIIERLAVLEKKVALQDVALHGLRDGCAERSRTLESLKDWTETRLVEIKDGFDDLDSRLGKIIDALSDLTEKMLTELESWEQEQAGIDDGNSVELASAPAEGE